ncbi:hypothetical protein BA187_13960 [Serratia marcescens]|nr:hypothetical protein BA187_13960 [Serratia marcescens]
MRVFRARRNENDISADDRQHFSSHPQRTAAFQNDEHFFLSVVKMVGAGTHARRHAIERGAQFVGGGAGAETGADAVIQRRPPVMFHLYLFDIAYQALS